MDIEQCFEGAVEYAFTDTEQDELNQLTSVLNTYIEDHLDDVSVGIAEQAQAIALLAFAAGRNYQDNSDVGKVTLTISAFSASRLLEALLEGENS